ncbi:MAG: alpha/beta hydrolase [Cytophagales bacterium]|nr:alpha/beta hydrolase [Cytophagales bacterium]
MRKKKKNFNSWKAALIKCTLRGAFPVVETLSVPLASRWAFRLFLTPVRIPYSQRDLQLLDSSERQAVVFRGLNIQTYRWGEKDRPMVLLVPGWSGKTTQFFQYIPKLLQEDFQVLAFDPPGHGFSEGKRTGLPEYADTIVRLNEELGGFNAIIGHSMGGSAAFFAVQKGVKVDGLVAIGSPSIGWMILEGLRQHLNFSKKTHEGVARLLAEKFGQGIEEAMPLKSREIIEKGQIRLLIVHDKDDKNAPFAHAEHLHTVYGEAETIFTEGFGHSRILREEAVTDKVVSFVSRLSRKKNKIHAG